MTKESDKTTWLDRYNNKSISGIELRDGNGTLCNFIAIFHDEVLDKSIHQTHRVAISVDDKGKPILPPAQTFDEIIQAKRRHQQLLYGAGNSAAATVVSSRSQRMAASRSAAAAAAASVVATAAGRRRPPTAPRISAPSRRRVGGARRKPAPRRRPAAASSRRRAPPPPPQQQVTSQEDPGADIVIKVEQPESVAEETIQISPVSSQREVKETPATPVTSVTPVSSRRSSPERHQSPQSKKSKPRKVVPMTHSKHAVWVNLVRPPAKTSISTPEPVAGTSGQVVTSLKQLYKNKSLATIDPKEVKKLLKSAAPGTSVVLPNGAVITKSRRGGARAGAGRKRSRPATNPDHPARNDDQTSSGLPSGDQSIASNN